MYSEKKKEMKGSCIHDSIQEQELKLQKQSSERLILLELIKVIVLKSNYLKKILVSMTIVALESKFIEF